MIVTDNLIKYLIFLGTLILLFVVYNDNVKFTWIDGGLELQNNDSSSYDETILVKNIPRNRIKQSKMMIAYFDSVGFTLNDLSKMSGVINYTMSFYKSTSATIRYFVKKEPNLYTYNGNKTFLGYVAIGRCENDSTKWNVRILRNLETAGKDYEYSGPNMSRTMLLDECNSYIPDDEKNNELVRYYQELRNKKKAKNNIQ
jgi:hypothetical protein